MDRAATGGFEREPGSGEQFRARAVVVGGGAHGFAHTPGVLRRVTPDGPSVTGPVSHSSQHTDLGRLTGARRSPWAPGSPRWRAPYCSRRRAPPYGCRPAGGAPWASATRRTGSRACSPSRPSGGPGPCTPSPTTPGMSGACPRPCGCTSRAACRAAGCLVAAGALRGQGHRQRGPHPARRLPGRGRQGRAVHRRSRRPGGRVPRRPREGRHRLPRRPGGAGLPRVRAACRAGPYRRLAPRLGAGFGSSVPGRTSPACPPRPPSGPVLRLVCGTEWASPRPAAAVTKAYGRWAGPAPRPARPSTAWLPALGAGRAVRRARREPYGGRAWRAARGEGASGTRSFAEPAPGAPQGVVRGGGGGPRPGADPGKTGRTGGQNRA